MVLISAGAQVSFAGISTRRIETTSRWKACRASCVFMPQACASSSCPSEGNFLLIYICNFHVLSHLLLIYICKLHWCSEGRLSRSQGRSRQSIYFDTQHTSSVTCSLDTPTPPHPPAARAMRSADIPRSVGSSGTKTSFASHRKSTMWCDFIERIKKWLSVI